MTHLGTCSADKTWSLLPTVFEIQGVEVLLNSQSFINIFKMWLHFKIKFGRHILIIKMLFVSRKQVIWMYILSDTYIWGLLRILSPFIVYAPGYISILHWKIDCIFWGKSCQRKSFSKKSHYVLKGMPLLQYPKGVLR